MKIKILSAAFVSLIFFTACEKSGNKGPVNAGITSSSTTSINASRGSDESLTLAEFAASCTSEQETGFFATTAVTDNNTDWTDVITASTRPRFRWHGTDGEPGCQRPLGICLIIPIGMAGYPDVVETPSSVNRGKLVLKFREPANGNNGVTTDGFMPILFNVELPGESCDALGVSKGTRVKAGIYKAHYNPVTRTYDGIVLDLI